MDCIDLTNSNWATKIDRNSNKTGEQKNPKPMIIQNWNIIFCNTNLKNQVWLILKLISSGKRENTAVFKDMLRILRAESVISTMNTTLGLEGEWKGREDTPLKIWTLRVLLAPEYVMIWCHRETVHLILTINNWCVNNNPHQVWIRYSCVQNKAPNAERKLYNLGKRKEMH